MPAQQVDVVIVIDASASMKPCIDQLRQHLRELVKPLQGTAGIIRFGLVAVNALKNGSGKGSIYNIETLAANGGEESLDAIYGSGSDQRDHFTQDTEKILKSLGDIQLRGDENNLLALDVALDHPFGPVSTTKRVVALFSDERLETGIDGARPGRLIPALIEKIHKRRIKLFCALPMSEWAQELSQANGSEIEAVDGTLGLTSVDFRSLLSQMGKSISVSSIQGGLEESYSRALFGQDRWSSSNDFDSGTADKTQVN